MSRAKAGRFFRYNLLKSLDSTSFPLSTSKYSHHFPLCCQFGLRQQSSASGTHHEPTTNSYKAKSGETAAGSGSGREEDTMKSWQMHSYGGPAELQLSTRERIPTLNGPDEVLVKIHAASVNPIDLAMTKG